MPRKSLVDIVTDCEHGRESTRVTRGEGWPTDQSNTDFDPHRLGRDVAVELLGTAVLSQKMLAKNQAPVLTDVANQLASQEPPLTEVGTADFTRGMQEIAEEAWAIYPQVAVLRAIAPVKRVRFA